MVLNVVRQGIEVERLVGETTVQLPVRAEALIPGAGRDSVGILMADGFATVTGGEVQNDRVVVSGTVFCQAAYQMGQESGARALTAQSAYEQVADVEGAAPKMSVQTEVSVDHVEASYESGHMVFLVTVTLRIRVCSLDTVEAVSEIAGIEGVERQKAEICSAKLNAEASDAISLHDEVSLPAALNARVTLMQWAEPSVEKVERDLGGVRTSGEVRVETLIATGVAGRPVALVRYTLPFEQMISVPDWISGEPEASTEVGRLQLDVKEGGEGEDARLTLDCDLNISVRLNGQDCMNVMTDAYATGEVAIEGEHAELTLCAGVRSITGQEAFRSTLLLPEDAPSVGTVLAVRAHPSVGGWRTEGGKSTVDGVLEATVMYMAAGGETLSSAQAELPFSLKLGCALGDGAWVRVTATDAEAGALMSDRLELKCALRAVAVERMNTAASVLTDVREKADAPARSGIGICYPQPGDTLWSIGKKYRVSEEALRVANGGVERAEPGKPLVVLRSGVRG